MDDHFGLGLRIGGRPSKAISFNVDRELEATDLDLLDTPRQSTAPAIKKLRERHHALAKVLAQGMPDGEAALICGYSQSRLSILKSDASFRDLIVFYQDAGSERFIDQKIQLNELGIDALDDIRTRMENDEEPLTLQETMEIAKLALDRSGFGPSSKTTVDIKVGIAERMHKAQERLIRMRDVTPDE